MNERIKELLEQASEYAHENRAGDWEVGPAYQDIFNEKFAELIVQESKQLLLDMINSEQGNFDTLDLALTKINEHFGVEE